MSHNWGYTQGKKMAKEIGLSPSTTKTKVAVKAHSRAPRAASAKTPPVPTPPSKDTPTMAQAKKFAKGGAVKRMGPKKPKLMKPPAAPMIAKAAKVAPMAAPSAEPDMPFKKGGRVKSKKKGC